MREQKRIRVDQGLVRWRSGCGGSLGHRLDLHPGEITVGITNTPCGKDPYLPEEEIERGTLEGGVRSIPTKEIRRSSNRREPKEKEVGVKGEGVIDLHAPKSEETCR